MNTPTPEEHKALWTKLFNLAHDEIFDDFEQSDGPAHQLIADSEAKACDKLRAQLTTERDQLRAVFPQICAAIGNGAFCTPTVSVGFIESIPNEVQLVVAELRARAERAEAEVAKLTGFYNEIVVECGHDLIVREYRQRGELLRGETNRRKKAEDELAAERARLDSGQILLTVAGERVWHCGVDLRAAIDAGMKEDAK